MNATAESSPAGWDYYATASCRIKNDDGSADSWWLRFPVSYDVDYGTSSFYYAFRDDVADKALPMNPMGVAPAGCF